MKKISIKTNNKDEIIDITHFIEEELSKKKIISGFVYIYCPHTTAGLIINENADKDVKHDIILGLNDIVKELINFKHIEGNSSAHIKSLLSNKFLQIAIDENKLVLGTWDGIYFCEFDGPRHRNIFVKFIKD